MLPSHTDGKILFLRVDRTTVHEGYKHREAHANEQADECDNLNSSTAAAWSFFLEQILT
jgi:hypothetical protein